MEAKEQLARCNKVYFELQQRTNETLNELFFRLMPMSDKDRESAYAAFEAERRQDVFASIDRLIGLIVQSAAQ
jgi:hypothetical protein